MLSLSRLLLPLLLCLAQVNFATAELSESRVLYENRIPDGPAVLIGEIGIAGKTYPLMVDTGAEAVLIADSAIAAQYSAAQGETRIEYTEFKGRKYAIPQATVGGLTIPASVVSAYDLSPMRSFLGISPFGVLGWKALKGNSIHLNHDAGKFLIVEGSMVPPKDWTTLPVTFEHDTPSIHAPLGGKDYVWAIDTGFNDTILVSNAHFERLVADGFIRESTRGSLIGVEGDHTTRSGSFKQGTLLGVELAGLDVTTEPRNFEVLGMVFLKKLNCILSVEPSRFSYAVRKNPPHPISDELMLGTLFSYDKGQAVVARVRRDANAEKAGLKIGDRVERIDEIGDGPLDAFRMYELCRKYAAKTVTLHIKRDGQPLTIQLPLTATVDAWNCDAPEAQSH